VTIHSPSSTSDYIPRDDVTEAGRIKAFGGQIGYGETIFEDDQGDEELKQAISEMVANGQVDFGEEGLY
jgi:hypothetical protein